MKFYLSTGYLLFELLSDLIFFIDLTFILLNLELENEVRKFKKCLLSNYNHFTGYLLFKLLSIVSLKCDILH